MMSEASFASLGPTLLARKGGAKPAMRPQLTPLPDNMAELAALADEQLEDLGWNDMGGEEPDSASDRAFGVSNTPAANVLNFSDKHPDEQALVQSEEEAGFIEPPISADIVPLSAHQDMIAPANEDEYAAESPVVRRQQERLAKELLGQTEQALDDDEAQAALLKSKTSSKASQTPRRTSKKRSATKAAKRAAFTLRLDTDRHLKLRLAATRQGVSAQSLVTDALDALFEDMDDLDTLVEWMQRD